jgi:hypothetical protein
MATDSQSYTHHEQGDWILFRILIAVLALAMSGCAGQGALYTRVITPYSIDFRSTPIGGKTCRVNEHVLKEPFSGAGISASFTSRIVEEAAHTAGITNLYYADLETLSFLKGVYQRKTLILCGD